MLRVLLWRPSTCHLPAPGRSCPLAAKHGGCVPTLGACAALCLSASSCVITATTSLAAQPLHSSGSFPAIRSRVLLWPSSLTLAVISCLTSSRSLTGLQEASQDDVTAVASSPLSSHSINLLHCITRANKAYTKLQVRQSVLRCSDLSHTSTSRQ